MFEAFEISDNPEIYLRETVYIDSYLHKFNHVHDVESLAIHPFPTDSSPNI